MGMIFCLATASDDTIAKVHNDPRLIYRAIYNDDPEIYEELLAPPKKPGFLARLFGAKEVDAPPPPPAIEFPSEDFQDYDLDKAWHGIHFLLTGSDWEGDPPLNFIVAGGKEIGQEDLGYGPGRSFLSEEVHAIDSALEAVTIEEFKSNFDPEAMMKADIYPTIWDRDPEDDDTLGYLVDYFEGLKRFISTAADKGLGLIVWIG